MLASIGRSNRSDRPVNLRIRATRVGHWLAAELAIHLLGRGRSANGENQLAPQMTRFADTVSFGGVGEIVSRDGWRRDRLGVQQRHDPRQVRAVTADGRTQYGDIRSWWTKSIRRRRYPDQPSTWLALYDRA